MSWIQRLGGRLPDFEDVVRRFPLPVAIMAAFTVWIIANNHLKLTSFRDEEYIASGFILAGYVSVIASLITEARQGSAMRGALLGLVFAVPAFLLSYFAKTLDFTTVMAIGAAILFLGNAAAWRAGRDDRNVWNFTQKLWTGALFATVGSVIFLLGMVAISEAVKALFGMDLDKLTFETLLPFGLAFLAPLYWFGTLPRYGEAEDVAELSFEARALSFLGTWMLAPLVIVYALIVLAYGAKVLIQWDLPKGEIAQLVSPFIGVGMLVWLMLEPKVLKESGFVRLYRAGWHWIMLPAAILLAVAVFVRIGEYGYTSERVFLALVVVWAFVQSLWFVAFPKTKRDIRVPTALAAALLTFGAFAAQPLSTMSQFNRAMEVKRELPVFEAEVLRNNPELAEQFLGGLKYLIQKEDEKRFKVLLPDREMPGKAYGPDYKALISSLGLDKVKDGRYNEWANFTVSSEHPIEIIGDSKLYAGPPFRLYMSKNTTAPKGIISSQSGSKVTLTIDEEIYRVDFEDIFSSLELVGQDDNEVDTLVPLIAMESESGVSATLTVLGGNLSYEGDAFNGGNITFAVIVPN
ncbi:MAG: DUF4153 domain-containing protein [Litorimonas sp.]